MAVYTPFVAGQKLTASDLTTLLITETMAWTSLASVGSFSAGFTAGGPTPRMRKVVKLGVEQWEFEGRINVTSLTAGSTVTVFTFSTGFRVASERGFQQFASNSGSYGARVGFTSAGVLSVSVPSAAGSSTSGFLLDGIIITDPLA